MKKLVGRISIYSGGGSGADAPPLVIVFDFNSKSSPNLDFNNTVSKSIDFNN